MNDVIDISGVIGWDVTAQDVKRQLRNIGEVDEIDVHLDSLGGYIDDGFGIYSALKNSSAKINIHITGMAASMASVIAMTGDTVTIEDIGMMMIHSPASGVIGGAVEMRKEADVLDKYEERLIKAYHRRDLNITDKQLENAVKNETWYTSDQALDAGFVDKIEDGQRETSGPTDNTINWLRIAGFKNAPRSIQQLAETSGLKSNVLTGRLNNSTVGSADETKGNKMTDKVNTVSEADHKAAVEAAVEANDKKWKALLSHENSGNTQALIDIAEMDLDAEKSAKLMDNVAKPAAIVIEAEKEKEKEADKETEAEKEKEKELAEAKAKADSELAAKFVEFMANSEVNRTNKSAASDGKAEENKKQESPEEVMARLNKIEVA